GEAKTPPGPLPHMGLAASALAGTAAGAEAGFSSDGAECCGVGAPEAGFAAGAAGPCGAFGAAFAAGGAGGVALIADLSSPSSSRIAITWLTGTSVVPSGTTILPIVPSSTASTSIVALSVSISAITSPDLTWSPSFLSHLARLPFSIVGDSAGMRILTGIVASAFAALTRGFLDRRLRRSADGPGFRLCFGRRFCLYLCLRFRLGRDLALCCRFLLAGK